MREAQRLCLRARLYCLGEVIEERAIERLGGWERAEEASEKRWDAAYEAAEAEIEKLVENGTLSPGKLAHKASLMTLAEAPKRPSSLLTTMICWRTSPRSEAGGVEPRRNRGRQRATVAR